jgi:methionyl-tRNA formyltransferase
MLKGIFFLASRTKRSTAYAQRLLREGLVPERTLIFGPPDRSTGQNPLVSGHASMRDVSGLPIPDPTLPVEYVVKNGGWSHDCLDTGTIRDPAILEWVTALPGRLLIYCGLPGQIVSEEFLARSPPVLHLHPGSLPEYKGSTTMYYQVLEEGRICVSAIILDAGIDSGLILSQKCYVLPNKALDLDHVFDGAVRADLLVRTLDEIVDENGEIAVLNDLKPSRGERTFYVIHPVLKHISTLFIDKVAKGL